MGSNLTNKATLFCCKIIILQVIKGVQFDSYQGFKLLTRMIACTKWRPKTLTIYIYICIIGSYIINGKKGQLYGGITKKNLYMGFTTSSPIALQNIIAMSVGLADNLMVGSLVSMPYRGVFAANQLQNLHMLVIGLSTALTVLAIQYWGRRT